MCADVEVPTSLTWVASKCDQGPFSSGSRISAVCLKAADEEGGGSGPGLAWPEGPAGEYYILIGDCLELGGGGRAVGLLGENSPWEEGGSGLEVRRQ